MEMEDQPEYTEFGIKIHKLRLTLKVQKRQSEDRRRQQPQEGSGVAEGEAVAATARRGRRRRAAAATRTDSAASSLVDSLRNLDLDTVAGSRRGYHETRSGGGSGGGTRPAANWEYQGFYAPPPLSPGVRTSTSTPSSGYGSVSVSRTSSFSSSECRNLRSHRLGSNDDSAYSEVYSTIEELSELADPFDAAAAAGEEEEEARHARSHSNATAVSSKSSKSSSTTTLEFDFPPPLPPRRDAGHRRLPARPPYPSSIVRAVQEITHPIMR